MRLHPIKYKEMLIIFMLYPNFTLRPLVVSNNAIERVCCLISSFDARIFWCTFVLSILKTNLFSHHLYKCNFIQNLEF